MSEIVQVKYTIGECVQHRLYSYRGVVVDVDAFFMGTEEWYDEVAKSRPSKNQPWYHVLVHDAEHRTYVAEQNIDLDVDDDPVDHPDVDDYFIGMSDGRYVMRELFS